MPGEVQDRKKYQRIMDSSSVFREWNCARYIGSGSFGTVLEIHKKRGGEISALKVIPIPLTENEFREKQQELGDDPQLLRLEFNDQIKKVREKEIGVLEQCRGQRNIVQVYESDVVPNPDNPICSYILIRMEMLYKIEDYLRGKTQKDVLRMFRDIAQALDFLESRRMLHRDIKRANIMINQSGDFKLTDFGEARDILTKNAASTKAGTPYFMAPEVWSGQRYDSRADIYSLAMTVYNCLYQFRYPFQQLGARSEVSAYEANQKRLEGRPIPPIEGVDPRLNEILLRCLQYEPSERYPSARLLLEDINRLMSSRNFTNEKLIYPGKVTSEGSSIGTYKPVPRGHGRIWAIVGGAVALVGAIVAIVLLVPKPVLPIPGDVTATPTVAMETPQALRIDELTINGMAAGGEPVQISMGTITIKWSSVGEVDHYTLSVKNGGGRAIIGPYEIAAGNTTAYISADDATLLTQEEVYTIDLSAVPGGSAQEAVSASAGFMIRTGEESGKTGTYKVTYGFDESAPANPPVLPPETSYQEGAEVTVAGNLTYPGYTFNGWRVDGVEVSDGKFTMPNRDVTIIGSWSVEEHTVRYAYNEPVPEDAPPLPEPELHAYGTPVKVAPSPELEGYTFSGWNYGDFTMGNDDMTITGSWTINQHAVNYAFQGDAPEGAAMPALSGEVHEYGDTVTLPEVPEVEGYQFTWSVNGAAIEGNTFTVPDAEVEVTGIWKPGSYSVTYSYVGDVPEGAPAAPEMNGYEYGQTVTIERTPTMPGYAVTEWQTGASLEMTGDGQFVMPHEDVAFTGEWIANPHTVTFIYTGNLSSAMPGAPEPQTHGTGEDVELPWPEAEGYTFRGWTAANLEIVDNHITMPDADVRLAGSWEVNRHQVSYVYDGDVPEGAPELPEASELQFGATGKVATVAGIEGYSFSGWTADNASVDANGTFTVPDADVVFHGSWTANVHHVSFRFTGDVPAGAEDLLPAALDCAYGEDVTLGPIALTGYGFSGWSAEGVAIENGAFTMPDADVELTGSWELGVYTVSYRYTGGALPEGAPELPEDARHSYGESVQLFVPELTGYSFSGWRAENADIQDGAFTMPDGDVELTGGWRKNSYAVRFEYDESAPTTVRLPDSNIYGYGDAIPMPVPYAEGYTFLGWTANGEAVEGDTYTMPDGEVTFVGSWQVNTHVLRFEYDESAPENAPALPEDVEYAYGHYVMPLAPTMEGFTFTGWMLDGTDAGMGFNMPDSDVTLVGAWVRNAHAAIFGYDESAPLGAPEPNYGEIYEYGQEVTLPAPEAEGYDFNGWSSDDVAISGDTFIMPDGDVTFVGGWTVRRHAVRFEYDESAPEGAPALPEDADYAYGQTVILLPPQLAGYTFTGWTAEGVEIADNSFAMPDFDVTLVGHWEEIRYTVTFDAAGGDPIPEAQSVSAFGQAAEPQTQPGMPGQRFICWLLNGQPYDFSAPVEGDITLTAQWLLDVVAEVPQSLRFSQMDGDGNISPQDIFIRLGDGTDLNEEQQARVSILRTGVGEDTLFAGDGIKWSRHGIEFGDSLWQEGGLYTLEFRFDGVAFDRRDVTFALYSGDAAPDFSDEASGEGNAQSWDLSMGAPEHLWLKVQTAAGEATPPAITLYYSNEIDTFYTMVDRITPIRAEFIAEDGQAMSAWLWDVAPKWGEFQSAFGAQPVSLYMSASFIESDTADQPYEVLWDWMNFDEETLRAQMRAQGYVFPDEAVEEEADAEAPVTEG